MLRNFAVALIALYALGFVAIQCAKGFGALSPPGATFDVGSGIVLNVTPRSAAWNAGIRSGDALNLSRATWAQHLSLNRRWLFTSQKLALPMLHRGKPYTALLSGMPQQMPGTAWSDFLAGGAVAFYLTLGLALYVMRPGLPTFFFLLLGVGQTCNYENLNYLHVVRDPRWMPLGMLAACFSPAAFLSAWLYFGALFGRPAGAYGKSAWYFLAGSVAVGEGLYYLHFFTATIWHDPIPFGTYALTAAITWLLQLAAAVAITLRVNRDVAEMRRMRWIATGVWMQVALAGIFFVQQSILGVGSDGTFLISALAWLLPPGTLCIAYALVRTRVIDVRVVGARTIVYASLTAIPIALFSIADWFFSRELADARLATFVEFGVAVFFGIWLNTLHKRIDRFVERIVFASRHHAFHRLHHTMHALSSVERSDTATALLCNEPASALRLASAAVFIQRGSTFYRVAATGWPDCAEQLDGDDPLVLFARSQHRAVRLSEVAQSGAALPGAEARPEIAVPIAQDHRIVGVALYGRHENGEHLDADEEQILVELAQAAAAALERLHSLEKLRELEAALRLQPATT